MVIECVIAQTRGERKKRKDLKKRKRGLGGRASTACPFLILRGGEEGGGGPKGERPLQFVSSIASFSSRIGIREKKEKGGGVLKKKGGGNENT